MKLCLAVLLFTLTLAAPAQAFYTRGYFERSAALGGAGRLYYTGSVRERGWDCTACHEQAAGKIRITFQTDPPDLIETGSYAPDMRYEVTVNLEREHLGFDAQFNSNGFVAEFSRGTTRAGVLSEGPGTELAENGRLVVSRNDTRDLATWTFRWTAPAAGTGAVLVNLGAVDGNGAGRSDLSFQDHLGDDVFVGDLSLSERPVSLGRALDSPGGAKPSPPPPTRAARALSGWAGDGGSGAWALVLALALLLRARSLYSGSSDEKW